MTIDPSSANKSEGKILKSRWCDFDNLTWEDLSAFTWNDLEDLSLSIKKIEKDKFSREDKLNVLSEAYKNGELVLVLGSGISLENGLPDWSTLLGNLFSDILLTIDIPNSRNLRQISNVLLNLFKLDPLIAARIIKHNYSSEVYFKKALKRCLYKKINEKFNSKLLQEICHLCDFERSGFAIDSIITYNFDDILESYLSEFITPLCYKTLYSADVHASESQIPIYHVHGFLPHQGDLENGSTIIFGEDTYHQHYNEIYSWRNLLQIDKFINCNCLFIGLSFTDPDLRRLLDISFPHRNPNKYHFLIKKDYNIDEVKSELNKIMGNNLPPIGKDTEITQNLIYLIRYFEEVDARSFGVIIIWVDDLDKDIPLILEGIRKH